ncbi:hypothetical protein, partial [Marinobacter salarius]|uniref:hypothetical protein n=1 Tax=Marinobacter salarius TaxID=1420917 RepID=UPI001D0FBAD6
HKNRNRLTHRDRSEYKTHSSVMAVCKSVTIPGMTGHVRRNTQWESHSGNMHHRLGLSNPEIWGKAGFRNP